MSKKAFKKTTKTRVPEAAAKPAATDYPQEHDLDGQEQRLRKAAAAGADALRAAPTAAPAPASAPAATASKPLTPLAALWPDPVPPKTGLSPRPVVKKPDTVFLVPEGPEEPQGPLTKAAAVGAAEPAPAPIPVPSKAMLPEPSELPEDTPMSEKASTPTAARSVEVAFVLLDLGAKEVSLCGDFNGWTPEAAPMKRQKDGHWEVTVALTPGRYEYKFRVDGQWIPDPMAQENVWNCHGTFNSVIEVRA